MIKCISEKYLNKIIGESKEEVSVEEEKNKKLKKPKKS